MNDTMPKELTEKVDALLHSAYDSGAADACPSTGGDTMTARDREAQAARASLVSAITAYARDERERGIEEAVKSITPPEDKTSDTLNPKTEFYPFLGESSWDLLARARERIQSLASASTDTEKETNRE